MVFGEDTSVLTAVVPRNLPRVPEQQVQAPRRLMRVLVVVT